MSKSGDRRLFPIGIARTIIRPRAQFETLDLTRRGLWQLRNKVKPTRVLVRSKPCFAVLYQFALDSSRVDALLVYNNPSFRFDEPIGIGTSDDRRFKNTGMQTKNCFNFKRRTPGPVDLKHIIAATTISVMAV